jgi:hypothetical protein
MQTAENDRDISSFYFGRNPVGVVTLLGHLPRVARASQPWAIWRNPFGISFLQHAHVTTPGFIRAAILIAYIFLAPFLSHGAADWQVGEGYRSTALTVPATGRTFLERLPPSLTGIHFTNVLSDEKAGINTLRAIGTGLAAGDIDGDGWCDLYVCSVEGANALYRNLGNWKFEDVTASAGVACASNETTGAVFADIDGDGDLDLLVNSLGGGTRLFLNDGHGHFTEATQTGLMRKFGATSMALADIDGNGTLDLYVANYATTKIEDHPNAKFDVKTVGDKLTITAIDGVPTTSPELTNRYYVDAERTVREMGEADILYVHDGHGKFRPVSWTDGSFLDENGKPLSLPPYDFGLSVMFRDMDGDGAPDIYICNDLFPPDRIWMNDGHGQFRALSNLAVRNTSRFSMGIDFADINRDGYDDFFVVDMLSREHQRRKVQTVGVQPLFLPIGAINNRPQYKRNTLFLNRGDGTYAEIAQLAGLDATEWSWMPVFLDVDLDGFEDVLVTTGHHRDSLNADAVGQILAARARRKLSDAEQRAIKQQFFPVLRSANQAFRNRGDLTFEDKAREWGFDYVGLSQALCLADLDNDGDLDVIVSSLNDAIGIYRNESIAPRVAVRLKGRSPNTRGIGAKIRCLGGPVPQSQEMICGGRYLAGDDAVRTFAAGPGPMRIEVAWRSGARSVITNVGANRLYEIEEGKSVVSGQWSVGTKSDARGAASPQRTTDNGQRTKPTTLFQDVSHLLQHKHEDDWFNDFERQPLLGRKLSQLGPGVSWYDVDGDGWDDLIIGSGRGGQLAVYRNDGRGGFKRWETPLLNQMVARDQTTILGWRKSDGQIVLLTGSSNYEDNRTRSSLAREVNLTKQTIEDNIPSWEISVGPLALADVDGDGTLDLFAGGRVIPGRYPEGASSLLFKGTGTQFVIDEDNCRRLGRVGLASGALFSDLDGDGAPDLVIACEWGPVRVFHNERGKLREITRELGLDRYLGWWNGVTTGDFDGDGRLDIVASNWGRNGKFQSHREQPLRIFCGEWTGSGSLDLMEAYYDSALKKVVPWCSFAVAKALPWVAERFTTQTAFGAASINDLLKERTATTKVMEANWLETTLFLNRGNHFEARILPVEAQFSPAFGIGVGDADGDGREDIFLSQNFFAVDGDTARYDAGRGLLLVGDGTGNFRAMPGQESGIKVYGEQRGCALCDYDGDGRLDLVVTQNGAETKLYRNERARPGLRVRLLGPPGNPQGVGAMIRLGMGDKMGPAREIHAGSGYWSLDSAVAVLTASEPITKIVVRWPGGKTVTANVPAKAHEITVDVAGQLKVVR